MSLRPRSRRLAVGLLFLLPNILGFLAYILVPLVMSVGMAFTDWDFLRHNLFRHEPLHFIALGNFARLFSHPLFWQYFGNTFFLMLGLPFSIAGSLGAALLLTRAGHAQHRIKPALILAGLILAGSGLMLLRGGMAESGVWFFFGLLAATTLVAGVVTGGMLYRTLFYLPEFHRGRRDLRPVEKTLQSHHRAHQPDPGPRAGPIFRLGAQHAPDLRLRPAAGLRRARGRGGGLANPTAAPRVGRQ